MALTLNRGGGKLLLWLLLLGTAYMVYMGVATLFQGFWGRLEEKEGLSSTNEDAKVRRQGDRSSYKTDVSISHVCMTGGSTSVAEVC
jgi:threonine/homoserine/homoserine lactone efflux protein